MCQSEENYNISTLSSIPMENFNSKAILVESFDDKENMAGEYDPFSNRHNEHPTSDFGVFVHLLKGTVGVGILAMPYAFENAGIIFGSIATFIIGFICIHCMQILVLSSHELCRRFHRPSLTFPEVAEMAFRSGPQSIQNMSTFFKKFVNITLAGLTFSSCSVYVVFISSSIQRVTQFNFTCSEINDVRIIILMLYLGFVFFGQLKNLSFMVPFSVFANLFMITGFGITLYYIFEKPISVENKVYIAPIENMPIFFSSAIFAMEAIAGIMPLENSMKNPQNFVGCLGVLNITMTIVVILYFIIGLFGFLAFGNKTEANITLNLPDNGLGNSVKIFVAMAAFFSMGFYLYVPLDITWTALEVYVRADRKFLMEKIFRMVAVTLVVAVAVAIPNLGPLISLVGAMFLSVLGLTCPAIIDIATRWKKGFGKLKWVLWKNIFIIIFSIFALVTGTYTSMRDIIEAYN